MLIPRFLNIFIGILFSINAFSTNQIPDKLVYEGDKYSLNSNPLESYFKIHPEKIPTSNSRNTALWRGYRATFEIQENKLRILDIQVLSQVKRAEKKDTTVWLSSIDTIFKTPTERSLAWYTGYLIMPIGRIMKYVHLESLPRYEKYIVIGVKNGIVFTQLRLNSDEFSQFMDDQFSSFKKTVGYKQQLMRIRDAYKRNGEGPLSKKVMDEKLRIYVERNATTIFK